MTGAHGKVVDPSTYDPGPPAQVCGEVSSYSPFAVAVRRGLSPTEIAEVNAAVLPELARAMTASTVEAVTGRLARAHSGGGGPALTVGGQSSLAGFLMAHGNALDKGRTSWRPLPGRSSFEVSLTGRGQSLDAGRLLFGQGIAIAGRGRDNDGYGPDERWRDEHWADPWGAGDRRSLPDGDGLAAAPAAGTPGSESGSGTDAPAAGAKAPQTGDVTLWGSGGYRSLAGDSGAVD